MATLGEIWRQDEEASETLSTALRDHPKSPPSTAQ